MNRIIILALFILGGTEAYSTNPTSPRTQQPINRLSFLKTSIASAGIALTTTATPVFAKEIDPAVKGTKQDPAYQACLSTCIFECTKPKGDEQKSRAECIPECKKKCATTKEQLMMGQPIKKD